MLATLRRLPMLLILVLGFSAFYLAFMADHEQKSLEDKWFTETKTREAELPSFIHFGQVLGSKGLWDELNTTLDEAQKSNRIDFYVLQYQGSAVWMGEKSGAVDVDNKYPSGDDIFLTPTISFRSIKIGNDYQLTVGIEKDKAAYLAAHQEWRYLSILQTSIYVFLIVILVGFFTLKDIMIIAREVKRGKRGKVSSFKASSAEAVLFQKGLTGYASAVADLEAENVRLGRQVLPSLQKEIHSGRKPPYDFDCTMVRTDINGFSTIFNTHNVTELMATINEFFDEVSRIVSRYGGLVHEFVGDEVIFYFKDDEHPNSFAIALSAIRDINELAVRFNAMTTEARGYPFTVKSSAAHGKVRFGPLVGGFTVAGAVLIETVRILGFVVEKDENVIYFDAAHVHRVQGLMATRERMQVKMKGYQNEVSLYQYDDHFPLVEILKTLDAKSVDSLTYYRSDSDLLSIIERLHFEASATEITLKAIRVLREPFLARAEIKLGECLRSWIEDLQTKPDSGKVLSAAVKLYINLVLQADFNADDKSVLQKLMTHSDRRVVANTVEVLTHFASEGFSVNPRLLKDDLRIAANSIVAEGRDEITTQTLKRLSALLRSKKANEIASGLFALGELAYMHRMRDMAYFSAQVDFQNLLSQLDVFAQHTTTMVRRQALTAARKSGHEEIIGKIRLHVRDSGSELLAEELNRYIDSSAVQKSSAA